MVKQVVIDKNNIILGYSIGGYVDGGINIDEDIPDDFIPEKYRLDDGKIVENPDFVPSIPSEEMPTTGERLDALEAAFMEFVEVMCDG